MKFENFEEQQQNIELPQKNFNEATNVEASL